MLDKEAENCNTAEDHLEFGHLFIDVRSKKVKIKDTLVPLTKAEFLILLRLASEPLRVYSRKQIINAVWDDPESVTEHVVDVHIGNLRKKLGQESNCILNSPGFGYEFNPRILVA